MFYQYVREAELIQSRLCKFPEGKHSFCDVSSLQCLSSIKFWNFLDWKLFCFLLAKSDLYCSNIVHVILIFMWSCEITSSAWCGSPSAWGSFHPVRWWLGGLACGCWPSGGSEVGEETWPEQLSPDCCHLKLWGALVRPWRWCTH